MHVHNGSNNYANYCGLEKLQQNCKKILGIAKNQGVSVAIELPLKSERYKEWAKSLREI